MLTEFFLLMKIVVLPSVPHDSLFVINLKLFKKYFYILLLCDHWQGCSCSGVKVDDWLRAERLAHDVIFDLNNYAQGVC